MESKLPSQTQSRSAKPQLFCKATSMHINDYCYVLLTFGVVCYIFNYYGDIWLVETNYFSSFTSNQSCEYAIVQQIMTTWGSLNTPIAFLPLVSWSFCLETNIHIASSNWHCAKWLWGGLFIIFLNLKAGCHVICDLKFFSLPFSMRVI